METYVRLPPRVPVWPHATQHNVHTNAFIIRISSKMPWNVRFSHNSSIRGTQRSWHITLAQSVTRNSMKIRRKFTKICCTLRSTGTAKLSLAKKDRSSRRSDVPRHNFEPRTTVGTSFVPKYAFFYRKWQLFVLKNYMIYVVSREIATS